MAGGATESVHLRVRWRNPTSYVSYKVRQKTTCAAYQVPGLNRGGSYLLAFVEDARDESLRGRGFQCSATPAPRGSGDVQLFHRARVAFAGRFLASIMSGPRRSGDR